MKFTDKEYEDAMRVAALIAECNAWRDVALKLHAACQEGGRKGRPMDLIHKSTWYEVAGDIEYLETLRVVRDSE